jgi:hypothetical protein
MVDMETISSTSDMKLEISGFVITGFDAPKLQQFTGLENNLLPIKQRPPQINYEIALLYLGVSNYKRSFTPVYVGRFHRFIGHKGPYGE